MIGSRTAVADRPHRISLQNPGPQVSDNEGGSTQSWTDLAPASVSAKIEPATTANLERLAAGTVVTTASHVVTMPYHPQVTTRTRISFNGRTFFVNAVHNPEERNVETIAVCQEIVG
jgi:SPP1 family predicted phage head-tail adaptor